jgi:predicted ATP-dependent endonuclease of OLD family
VKLTSVRVQNYRSIEDSGEVKIEDVTSLVGKNESGKTTFLRALHLLNPLNPIKSKTDFDDTIDYPSKNFSKYKRTKVASPAEVLNVKFELTDSEAKLVEDEFGKGFLKSKIPVPTKDTTIKETTALLCKIAVAKVPLKIAFKRVFVAFLKRFLNVLLTKVVIAFSNKIFPKRNNHNPHNNKLTSCNDMRQNKKNK